MQGIKTELLYRMYIVVAGFFLVSILLGYKTIKANVFDGEKWRELGEKRNVRRHTIVAERGNIFASDGSLLAASVPVFEIRMDLMVPSLTDGLFNKQVDSLAFCLSQHVNRAWSPSEWKQYLKDHRAKGGRYVLIAREVSFELMQKMKTFPIFSMGRNKGGFIALRKSKRQKPFKRLASRTIGKLRAKNMVGLEKQYDLYLRGQDGERLEKRMPGGLWIPVNKSYEISPKAGHDLKSTIDVSVQDIVDQALARAMRYHQASWGTAVVMEVQTGAIKAISNLSWQSGKLVEAYNYAIGSSEEPGSTFKLATMMALLEDRKVRLIDSVDLHSGKVRFYDRIMRDSHRHSDRKTSVRTVFEESSNVGVAQLAVQHYGKNKGAQAFIDKLKDFGLHQVAGIDLPGEKKPFIKDAYNYEQGWSGVSLPWMSTGYELTMTPIQTLAFYNIVASNGKRLKPYLVEEILLDGEPVKKFGPTVLDSQIVRKDVIEDLRKLLEGVVLRGTAKRLQSDLLSFAGKTGTALFDYGKEGEKRRKYQASFVGYFPADAPKYSCIVVLRDPKANGYYGGEVAGPVFKEIAERMYLAEHQVPIDNIHPKLAIADRGPNYAVGYVPDIKILLDSLGIKNKKLTNEKWGITIPGEDDLLIKYRQLEIEKTVPNVRGMGLRDAIFLLESLGLHVKAEGYGKVLEQSLKPGIKILGQDIKLKLG